MNIAKMMQQAQRMQSELSKAQGEISQLEKTFTTGGGAVEVVARGDNTIVRIAIKPEAIDPEDAEGLEDLILEAVNGALGQIRSATEARMSKVAGGLGLPGM